ncbi:MAG: amidase [Actinomycetota bacterium]
MADIIYMSALEQAALVRNSEISPVELVTEYLNRIDKFDDQINAFVTVVGDGALEAARRAEEEVAAGGNLPPFHGVPITIKDLNPTAGIKTTFSSKAFADFVPDFDAHTVRRIKEAGFISLGKTNAPEFGTFPVTESELNGICRNPWDTGRTPGGSSGGAAAAVAAGMCPAAQGNDGGGSLRIPASCCGLFGLKPARGRVSWGPAFGEFVAGLATDGPIARTVADAAALLDVMAGYETGDPYWAAPPARPFLNEAGAPVSGLRVGVTTSSPTGAPVDPACVAAVEDASTLLESLGHHLEEATPDWVDPDIVQHFMAVWQTIPVYSGMTDGAELEPINREFLEMASQTNVATYVRAQVAIHAMARRVVAFWDDYDLLLSPTLALPPVPVGWIFEEEDPGMQFARAAFFTPFTPVANITGQPAASLPTYWSDDGLPIGVQLMGRPADEATLIRVSAQVEEARPWADRRPPDL